MDPVKQPQTCPDCAAMDEPALSRREFVKGITTAAAAVAAGGWSVLAPSRVAAAPSPKSAAETAVKALYDKLTDDQKKEVCFDWDFKQEGRGGFLRNRVSNNWQITKPLVTPAGKAEPFFTKDQRGIIRDIFKGIFNPDWVEKIDKQLKDDTGGRDWGAGQSIAVFGKPGDDKCMFVMTGRHMTIRADGNSEGHVAFGGPIFHGHAASGFNEKPDHPGNIWWHQAVLANKLYEMLDGKQRKLALNVDKNLAPDAFASVRHKGPKGTFTGLPCSELAKDQGEHLKKVLMSLVEPYRKEDQEELEACLKAQGNLEACHLTFYQAGDIGEDEVWDNWRLDGPAFSWFFRGTPHVHIWINVADEPDPLGK